MRENTIILRLWNAVTFLKRVLSWCGWVSSLAIEMTLPFRKASTGFLTELITFITIFLPKGTINVNCCSRGCYFLISCIWQAIRAKAVFRKCVVYFLRGATFQVVESSLVRIDYLFSETNGFKWLNVIDYPTSTGFWNKFVVKYTVPWCFKVALTLILVEGLLHIYEPRIASH